MLRKKKMIEVFNISKKFNSVYALKNVNLRCEKGKITGLLGPNGAGKTTLLRILATIIEPSAGDAKIAEYKLSDAPLKIRERIGFLSSTTGLYPRLTVHEFLTFFAKLYNLSSREINNKIQYIGNFFKLNNIMDKKCGYLSQGQRQKVILARVLLPDPEILLLDEPTNGLDIIAASKIKQYLFELKSKEKTILFSTHNMDEAQKLCDYVYIINKGEIFEKGTIKTLQKKYKFQYLEDIFFHITKNYE